jgi:hypothetical protein
MLIFIIGKIVNAIKIVLEKEVSSSKMEKIVAW